MPRPIANVLPLLLLIAVALAIYLPGLPAPFIFDDHHGILNNHSIRPPWRFPGPLAPPPHGALGDRPVVNLTFALNHAQAGEDPRVFRLTNILIHIGCGLLVMGLIRRSLDCCGTDESTARSIATIASLLFITHPLQTEPVMYIVQRTESLMALCYLATLYAALRGWQANQANTAQHTATRRGWYVLAIIACLLGMGCKEVMVSAPLVVLLMDRALMSESFAAALRRRPWFYSGLAATWIPLAIMKATGKPHPTMGLASGMSPWHYLLTSASSLVEYLRLAVWPTGLTIMHDPSIARSPIDVWWQGLIVMALLAATVWTLVRRPVIGFFAAAFFLVLAPTTSVIPILGEVTAERRMYLPMAALIGLLAAALARGPRFDVTLRVAVAIIVCLGVASAARVRDYASEISIWTDAASKAPHSRTAQSNLAMSLSRVGRHDKALPHFDIALASDPNDLQTLDAKGTTLMAMGRHQEAIACFRAALRVMPQHAQVRYNLANALATTRQFEEAQREYESALSVDPKLASAWLNLGNVRLMRGAPADAQQAYEQALARGIESAPRRSNSVVPWNSAPICRRHVNLSSAPKRWRRHSRGGE